MTPTRLLIGQIVIVFGIVLLGIWIATQWAAAQLGLSAAARAAMVQTVWIAHLSPVVAVSVAIIMMLMHPISSTRRARLRAQAALWAARRPVFGSLWRARQAREPVTTYGSARWANPGDIEKAGLYNDAGVFLGEHRYRYLRHDGPEHVMAFAPHPLR